MMYIGKERMTMIKAMIKYHIKLLAAYFQLLRNGYAYLDSQRALDFVKFDLRDISPNLFILGAAKSGTTNLYVYLSRHPEIYMSCRKEPALYLDNRADVTKLWKKNQTKLENIMNRFSRWYKSDSQLWLICLQNYKGEPLIGEASPYYTFAPYLGTEVPSKLSTLKQAQFIYIMRNPLDRIVSHFFHDLKHGNVPNDFELCLKQNNLYLSLSLYAAQIKPYIKMLGREKFKFVKFEEFIKNPQGVLRDIFAFLSVNVNDYDYQQEFAIYNRGIQHQFTGKLKFPRVSQKIGVRKATLGFMILESKFFRAR
ncbi:MAG: sulfotransferase [Xenococcaceae cyanobacterium]